MGRTGLDWLVPPDGAMPVRPAMRGRRRFSWLGRAHLRPAMHGAEKGSVPLGRIHRGRESPVPQIITSEGAIRGHTAEQERNLPCCAPSCKPPGSPPRGLRLGA